jgi:hypothetical protein
MMAHRLVGGALAAMLPNIGVNPVGSLLAALLFFAAKAPPTNNRRFPGSRP